MVVLRGIDDVRPPMQLGISPTQRIGLLIVAAALASPSCGGSGRTLNEETLPNPPPVVTQEDLAGRSDGPTQGRYQCWRLGNIENAIADDLHITGPDTYVVLGDEGEYGYDSATGYIEWSSGPFAGDESWVGRFIPQGIDDYVYTTIEIWDRQDLAAGYGNPMQRCYIEGELASSPEPAATPMHLVRYEVFGDTDEALINAYSPVGMEDYGRQRIPWTLDVTLSAGAGAYVYADRTAYEGDLGCRIYVDGVLMEESAPGPYTKCHHLIESD